MDDLIGTVIEGRYRVDDVIGRGGCGTVYRARQVKVDRDVAIKLLTGDAAGSEDMVQRFESEARIISQLQHPNALKLIDFGQLEDGRIYLVTEFLRGAPLDEVLREGPLSPRRTLRIMLAVSKVLTEAHERGIVHRDLKPGNVFLLRVGTQEVVKVLDFGIAKYAGGESLTATGMVFGTPAFLSPEQARGQPVDGRSDLYSLGVLAYACLTGSPPFESENPVALLLKHVQETPTPFTELVPPLSVPSQVEALVMWLLAKTPEDRPQGAAEVASYVESLLADAHDADRRPSLSRALAAVTPTFPLGTVTDDDGPATEAEAPRPSRRGGVVAIALLAALAVGLGVAGWFAWPPAAAPAAQTTVPQAAPIEPGHVENAPTVAPGVAAVEGVAPPDAAVVSPSSVPRSKSVDAAPIEAGPAVKADVTAPARRLRRRRPPTRSQPTKAPPADLRWGERAPAAEGSLRWVDTDE